MEIGVDVSPGNNYSTYMDNTTTQTWYRAIRAEVYCATIDARLENRPLSLIGAHGFMGPVRPQGLS